MKLGHVIAIIAFGLSLLLGGNDYAQAVQTGASWGFWICLVLGSIGILIMLGITIFGSAAGGVAGFKAGGALGGILGGFGAMGILVLVTLLAVGSVLLAIFGYDALGDWGASGLEDKTILIRACVLLGSSVFLSMISSSSSS